MFYFPFSLRRQGDPRTHSKSHKMELCEVCIETGYSCTAYRFEDDQQPYQLGYDRLWTGASDTDDAGK